MDHNEEWWSMTLSLQKYITPTLILEKNETT